VVTAKTQYNLANAQEYFQEHLCVGDYYDEGQRVSGEWQGIGAARLGLAGKVRADDFLRLCENQHPGTGGTLAWRLNRTRSKAGETEANRRIFFDFTFSPPKSVSLAGFLGEDVRVLEAHARSACPRADWMCFKQTLELSKNPAGFGGHLQDQAGSTTLATDQ
jgi:conjugative relaxase-like TrwC/TraI family protein